MRSRCHTCAGIRRTPKSGHRMRSISTRGMLPSRSSISAPFTACPASRQRSHSSRSRVSVETSRGLNTSAPSTNATGCFTSPPPGVQQGGQDQPRACSPALADDLVQVAHLYAHPVQAFHPGLHASLRFKLVRLRQRKARTQELANVGDVGRQVHTVLKNSICHTSFCNAKSYFFAGCASRAETF